MTNCSTWQVKGTLHRPSVLRKQVERMLKNPKSKAFTNNFTGQWLALRDIDLTEPDKKLYPEFDEPLKVAMIKENAVVLSGSVRQRP